MKKELFLVILGTLLLVSIAGAQVQPPIGLCPPPDPNIQCIEPPPESPLIYCFRNNQIVGTYNDPCIACNVMGCEGIAPKEIYDQWLADNQPAAPPTTQEAQQPSQTASLPQIQCPSPAPTDCPEISDPVCGSDGSTTYPNPCVACAKGASSFTPGSCSGSQTIESAATQFLQEDPSLQGLGSTNIEIAPGISGESAADISATSTTEETEEGIQQTTTIEIRDRADAQQSAEITVTQENNGNINSVTINLDEATISAK